MKKTALVPFVFVYLMCTLVTFGVLGIQARYDCYSNHGVIGIIWCPESASQFQVLVVFGKALFWPYHLYIGHISKAMSARSTGRLAPICGTRSR